MVTMQTLFSFHGLLDKTDELLETSSPNYGDGFENVYTYRKILETFQFGYSWLVLEVFQLLVTESIQKQLNL